jgi:hypothetical protein
MIGYSALAFFVTGLVASRFDWTRGDVPDARGNTSASQHPFNSIQPTPQPVPSPGEIENSPPVAQEKPAAPPNPPEAANPQRKHPPGSIAERWHQEFGRDPTECIWPGHANTTGNWGLDEKLHSLVIQNQDTVRFVALEELKPMEDGLTLGVDFYSPSSNGSYGIFLGYKVPRVDNPRFAYFQAIQLEERSNSSSGRTLIVSRYLGKTDARQGKVIPESGYSFVDVVVPRKTERLSIEIQIRNHILNKVMVCGQECPDLCIPGLNANYSQSDYLGPLGLFSRDATVWFSNPHFQGLIHDD